MFFSSSPKQRLILLLELQSSLVRGSLVLMHASGTSQTIFAQSLEIPYKPGSTSSYYVKTALKGLRDMIGVIQKNLYSISRIDGNLHVPRHIDEIHYVLLSPWVISQARTVSVSFATPTTMTEERLRQILSDERERISFDKRIEVETIEEKIFEVRLNGYSIAAWKGKEAKELEVSYALSVGNRESISELKKLAAQEGRCKEVFFHSSLLLQYVSMRAAIHAEDSYTLIHVHGELTDLVVVRRGLCSFFGSFPVGINTMLRKVGEVTGTDRQAADSLLSLYLADHIEEASQKKIGIVISNMAWSWTNELGKLWSNTVAKDILPETVYIIARAHEDFFSKSFRAAHPRAKIGKLSVDMTSNYALAIHNVISFR